MKNSKLVDLLQKSPEEQKSEDIQYRVESAKLQLQSDLLATKKSLSAKQKEIDACVLENPLSFKKLAELEEELASIQRGVKALEGYQTKFF
jgi:uncharacterized Zn finger protein (UPF0148 family)